MIICYYKKDTLSFSNITHNLQFLFFHSKYFTNNQLLATDRGTGFSTNTRNPYKYAGSGISLDDQCKLVSPDYVYYKRVRKMFYEHKN